ncbi:MAG TPA: O-antigen polymerase [Vicinamibacterales bacterium]|nr:O-antigen polymerase [Vicinamibacterales bacterium]
MASVVREQYGPLLGMATTILGTMAALLLFPEDPSPPGALRLPATALAVGIVFVPAMRIITNAKTMMHADNFVAAGYVGWLLLDLIQGGYELNGAPPDSLRDALMAVGVSGACMWAGALGRPWPLPKWLITVANNPLDSRTVGRLIPICFFLGMFNYMYSVEFRIFEMFSYLGNNRWAVPWSRGQLGGWGSFIDQMPYFGYVLPSLTALLIARRGFRGQTWWALGMSLIMLLFLAQGGGRRIIMVTVGAALIVWVQAQPGMKVRKVATVGAVLLALVWTMQFMLHVRTRGIDEFLNSEAQYDYVHVDDNFLRLAQVIDILPQRHDFIYHQQIYFTLIRPVPRALWPNKPLTPGFDLASEVGLKGVSLSSSILGEWYISWGWPAIILGGWLHGRLAASASTLRQIGDSVQNPIVYALAVMVLVAGMRSMQDLVIMSYALVAWWGANRLVRSRE